MTRASRKNQDRAGEANIRDLPCAGFVSRDMPAQSKNLMFAVSGTAAPPPTDFAPY